MMRWIPPAVAALLLIVSADAIAGEGGKNRNKERSAEETALRKACKRAAKKHLPNATKEERRQFARECRKGK